MSIVCSNIMAMRVCPYCDFESLQERRMTQAATQRTWRAISPKASRPGASRSARCCRPSSSCASRIGASRYTVRKALHELQELGLISRRKNVGTRVEAARPTAGFTQSIASVDELAQFGADACARRARIEDVVADLALAKELGCAAASAGCASRACAWTAAPKRGRSAGPTSMSTRLMPRSATSCANRPDADQLAHRVALRPAHRAHPAGDRSGMSMPEGAWPSELRAEHRARRR